MAERNYIIQTNYFASSWTWIKRFIFFLLLVFLIIYWKIGIDYSWIKPILISLSLILLIGWPKDELALDNKYLYYRTKSIFPFLCKEIKLETGNIVSIRFAGYHTKTIEFLEFLTPGNTGTTSNSVEINFKDNTSQSLEISIYKKDLRKIVDKINEMKNSA